MSLACQSVAMSSRSRGDLLPDMQPRLDEDSYVPVPLEATYQTTWNSCPVDMRRAVELGLPLDDEAFDDDDLEDESE